MRSNCAAWQMGAFGAIRFRYCALRGLVIEKAGRPVVTALHDVQRQAIDMDACAARHAASLAEIEPGPFSLFSLPLLYLMF